jgi:release factor glutamine methyltransferase
VIEVARAARPDRSVALRMLDLCTGSGVIAVSLAKEYPAARIVATEISSAAAAVARKNAARNAVDDRAEIREGDLFGPAAGERFDVITANPPYIASAIVPTLASEVLREPVIALDGGPDGLAFYDRICAQAIAHLVPGGALIVEHGYDQAGAVRARFAAAGFADITLVHDLGKNPRVTWGTAR